MLFLVLLNVWCSHPGFLKMVPHPAPARPTNSWHVCQSFISTFPLVDLCTRCSQATHGWREVSESSCSLGKDRTKSEITSIWNWGRSSQSWASSQCYLGKQWPAGLYKMQVMAPMALSSHTACGTGYREGQKEEAGRMGIAGYLD